jgi:hypothetical protein
MDMRDMMQKTIDTLAAENEALRRPPTERPYVCPCPDGCNGCEVPDFALKEIERLLMLGKIQADRLNEALVEIERLTAERDASRRMYVDACLKVAEMTQRIAELEAALREITSDELYNEAQMAIIADEALANSEGEK